MHSIRCHGSKRHSISRVRDVVKRKKHAIPFSKNTPLYVVVSNFSAAKSEMTVVEYFLSRPRRLTKSTQNRSVTTVAQVGIARDNELMSSKSLASQGRDV